MNAARSVSQWVNHFYVVRIQFTWLMRCNAIELETNQSTERAVRPCCLLRATRRPPPLRAFTCKVRGMAARARFSSLHRLLAVRDELFLTQANVGEEASPQQLMGGSRW